MKIKLTTKLLLTLFASTLFFSNLNYAANSVANSVGQTNEPSPIQVIIMPNKTQVHVKEPFTVSVEIKNVSNTNQQFTMWSCSWRENWKLDNSIIWLGDQICVQDWLIDTNLGSGKYFKGDLNIGLLVSHSVPTNKISFRLGFTPNRWSEKEFWDFHLSKNKNKPNDPLHELGTNTYWSNETVIDLIPN